MLPKLSSSWYIKEPVHDSAKKGPATYYSASCHDESIEYSKSAHALTNRILSTLENLENQLGREARLLFPQTHFVLYVYSMH